MRKNSKEKQRNNGITRKELQYIVKINMFDHLKIHINIIRGKWKYTKNQLEL